MGGTMKSLRKVLAMAGAAIGATAMALAVALPASAATQGPAATGTMSRSMASSPDRVR